MKNTPFTDEVLAGLGPDLKMGAEVIALMRWLEGEQNNLFHYTSTDVAFLAVMPVPDINAMWSHLAFVIDPEMFDYYLGRKDLANTIVSILRCGGDGSHIALWRDPTGAMKYVFCGSEGDTFVVAENGLDFVRLLAMGYEGIEGRFSLEDHPRVYAQEYGDGEWPEPVVLKDWVCTTFNTEFPETGTALLPVYEGADPFATWVSENNKN